MNTRRFSVLGFALAFWALLPGCQKDEIKPSPSAVLSVPAAGNTKPATTADTLEATQFTATVKGRVTYNGDEPPKVQIYKTSESSRKYCPPEVPTRGWYCDASSDKKGVRYAVVFLKPEGGRKMPKLPDNYKPPAGQEVVTIEMRGCQYHPRVTVIGPSQDLRFFNSKDSLHGH